ncbi:hypothetical protein COV24_03615 [candidate division WWE3 bacterium CG10_big_fil_rev_8_21_14_0_10_32_10]|uniref:Dockerin domain-containing protein n=1 Tax=candidate division WWE3 bacterium CG10_big_fil_rev_8_21_14_0_10_32_10 TaxID=1975090 RepID=A0A2H0R9R6_UNCKA|nr:MAG: hypothetical protein COV24_03615 [candidate division WWE3 bacterium CG10_big_fil_rev_8_21_14_0_10_32_10]
MKKKLPFIVIIAFVSIFLLFTIKSKKSLAQTWPTIDPVTREYYDVSVMSDITTQQRTGPGPSYAVVTTFRIVGVRVNYYSKIYGFLQKPYSGIEPGHFELTRRSTSSPYYDSVPVPLVQNGCIDLHSNPFNIPSSYIATFCYTLGTATPNTSGIMYGPNTIPYISYTYKGTTPASLEIISLAFNKYEQFGDISGVNGFGGRVVYLTVDTNANTNNFSPVTYHLQAITTGLTTTQATDLCDLGSNYPTKYFRYGYDYPIPEGGNLYPITAQDGHCQFSYTHNYLLPWYISLYVEGGTPIPSLGVSPNPTPTPPRPRNSLLDLNEDTTVDIQDIIVLVNEVFKPTGIYGSDVNGDGSIDIIDIITLINVIFFVN